MTIHDIGTDPLSPAMTITPEQVVQQASATVPEGYALVPMKPTERMLDHAVSFALNVGPAQSGGWTEYARRMWETMVIAAASQPAGR